MSTRNSKIPANRRPQRRDIYVYILFTVLILGALSIFLINNFVNAESFPPKTLQEFQNDIAEAVKAGKGNLPKFTEVVYDAGNGNFFLKRIFIFNGKEVFENYSVLALIGSINPNPLDQAIEPGKPLTYIQAILTNSGAALANGAKFFFKISSKPWTYVIWDFLSTLFGIVIQILVFVFIFRYLLRGIGGGAGSLTSPFGRVPAHKIRSKIKFSDVAGAEEVKEEVMELVDYLKNPKRYSQVGARIPKGILMGGPPGTGKTLVAKAVAGEASVPFYFISASSFIEIFSGLGPKRVRDIFNQARADSPAIIFIDELDAVGRSRNNAGIGSDSERESTLNQLLVEMDGMLENSGILVMAATNRHDVLDEALLRPGRFDRIITITLPDIKEREAILRLHARGKRFHENVSFKNIAKRTPGFSGAQLENVINEASLLSVRERSLLITMGMIDEAIDRVMSGPARKSRAVSKEELRRVAYHEAGHAVTALKIEGAFKVQKITIIARGSAGGYNMMTPENETNLPNKNEILANIASLMGGRAAEEIIFGATKVSTGASDDIEKATSLARRMVTVWGMSKLGPIKFDDPSNPSFTRGLFSTSQQTQQLIDQEVSEIIGQQLELATKTISENMQLLELIKDTLLEKETIVMEEIEYLAKNLTPLPKDEDLNPNNTTSKQKEEDLGDILKEAAKS